MPAHNSVDRCIDLFTRKVPTFRIFEHEENNLQVVSPMNSVARCQDLLEACRISESVNLKKRTPQVCQEGISWPTEIAITQKLPFLRNF